MPLDFGPLFARSAHSPELDALIGGMSKSAGESNNATTHLPPPGPALSRVPKKVVVIEPDSEKTAAMSQIIGKFETAPFNYSPSMAKLLALRGHEPGPEFDRYLKRDIKAELSDIWSLKNLDKACDLFLRGLKDSLKFGIIGDSDVDGTTGASTLRRALEALGGNVESVSADRRLHGFGPNREIIESFHEQGVKVLVTIDCGAACPDLIQFAKSFGMEVIVLDHHYIPEPFIAPCEAFVDPGQPGCNYANNTLCASGVTLCAVIGLWEKILESPRHDPKLAQLAESAQSYDVFNLAQLGGAGTVQDMMPLVGKNRAIVYEGIQRMMLSPLQPFETLKKFSGIEQLMCAADLAFGTGPRGNAPGRMAEIEELGISGGTFLQQFYLCDDPVRSMAMGEQIEKFNDDRKKAQRDTVGIAQQIIATREPGPGPIILFHPDFDEGVVGLGAQELSDALNTVVGLFAHGKNDLDKGSWRNPHPEAYHMVKGLESVKHALEAHGGHAAAAGSSNKPEAREELVLNLTRNYLREIDGKDLTPILRADLELTLSEFKRDGVRMVQETRAILEPCGKDNPEPVVKFRNLLVQDVITHQGAGFEVVFAQSERVNRENASGLELGLADTYITGRLFQRLSQAELVPGVFVDIAATGTIRGNKLFNPSEHELELRVADIQLSKMQRPYFEEIEAAS